MRIKDRALAAAGPLAGSFASGWVCWWSSQRWEQPFPEIHYMSGWAWAIVTIFAGVGALQLALVALASAVAARTIYGGDVIRNPPGSAAVATTSARTKGSSSRY